MKEKVYETIKELSGIDNITDDMNLQLDLGFDSLTTITMLVMLEEKAEIEFDASDITPEDITTVENVITLMKKYEVKNNG